MSTVFYDRLIILDDIDKVIKNHAGSEEERAELWHLVDEIIHHRVMGCILDQLPQEKHHEFLEKFTANPHDESLLDWLGTWIGDVAGAIGTEIKEISSDILKDIK